MRRLVYILSNGTIETSMAEAQASGLSYKVALENIAEEPSKLSPKQAERRKTATLRK